MTSETLLEKLNAVEPARMVNAVHRAICQLYAPAIDGHLDPDHEWEVETIEYVRDALSLVFPEGMLRREDPVEVQMTMVASTAHMSPDLNRYLMGARCRRECDDVGRHWTVEMIPGDHGWRITRLTATPLHARALRPLFAYLMLAPLPFAELADPRDVADLRHMLWYAFYKRGFTRLDIDQDGPVYRQWEQYEW